MSGNERPMQWVSDLFSKTADEVMDDMNELGGIRCEYPGLCSINFEFLLDIVLDKLVGDNPSREGIFGILEAYGVGIEEQGRKTLHGHILVFIKKWNELLRDLASSNERKKAEATKKVRAFVDSILSTSVTSDNGTINRTVSDVPKCPSCESTSLMYPSQQGLRFLRHKIGCQQGSESFANCNDCVKSHSAESLLLHQHCPLAHQALPKHHQDAMLKRDVLDIQTWTPSEIEADSTTAAIKTNLLYNRHLATHTRTCYKKGPECRAFLPDQEELRTDVIFSNTPHEGFAWTGETMDLTDFTVRPKRLPHHAYINSHSLHLSRSLTPTNSNIGILTGPRSCIYCTCYSFKATQKEDTQELKRMLSYVSHRFIEERCTSTMFEGISRLMGAAIVATSQHIVSAPMASFLVRNKSRFKCSHMFKYVPIREMVQTFDSPTTTGSNILDHDSGCFLHNDCLQYIHRPSKLNEISLFDFCQDYETVRHPKSNKADEASGEFDLDSTDHPGYGKQVCRQRKMSRLAQFSHWAMPDAAGFNGVIWTLEMPVNATVEKYCQTALMLFVPFRNLNDLVINQSFFLKFRSEYSKRTLPPRMRTILSNVQMFYNSMRMPARTDPINNATAAFVAPDEKPTTEEEEDDSDFFDGMFSVLQRNANTMNATKDIYSTDPIKKDGARMCGYSNLPPVVQHQTVSDVPFFQPVQTGTPMSASSNNGKMNRKSRDKPSPTHLMSLVHRNQRRRISVQLSQHPVDDLPADGSALSIMEWSMRTELNLDREQQTAFQISVASFVLTYYEDAASCDPGAYRRDCINPGTFRQAFNDERRKLQVLTRLPQGTPLRMFLDGPGGAGKSRVVLALLSYAQDFTTKFNFTFDMRTIVVSARSGVAAVSINGETTHSVASMNAEIKPDDCSWANARLFIVDEISFMNVNEIEILDGKLRALLHNNNSLYGGMNMLFAGDFRQLEPITGKPLYSSFHADKKWVHSINTYVELTGLWRFLEDPEWGRILTRVRADTHNQHDIDAINACTLENRRKMGHSIPPSVAYCVHSNKDRCAIDTALFERALETKTSVGGSVPEEFICIKAADMKRKHKSGQLTALDSSDVQFILENCGDNRVSTKRSNGKGHFVAPLLKLHRGQPLMLVSNDDVANGHANGTRVTLQSVLFKSTETMTAGTLADLPCRFISASDVDYLLCTSTDNPNKEHRITLKKMTCNVKAPLPSNLYAPSNATVTFSIQLTQFPLITNYATTGHKLQGQTKIALVIATWSKRRNWNYVALSRVKTRKGLFLVKPLPYDADFSFPPDLRAMLLTLRTKEPSSDVDIDFDVERARTPRQTLFNE